MNNKIYRLLRSNKEQGPFTSEELIQKKLKPFDLIWIDGRSAAWSYPAEIPELKMYVPGDDGKPLNSFAKKRDTASQVSNSIQAAVAVNDNLIKTGTPVHKPRYKVSAAWSKIQTITTPAYNEVMVAAPKKISSAKIIDTPKAQPADVKSLSWEQAWLDWEHEKKAVVPVKPLIAQTLPGTKKEAAKHTKAAPVLEKKFEQSLDTITHNYIDNILQQKKKSRGFTLGKASEFVLPSLALIIIFSIAYWFLHDTKVAAVANGLPAKQQQTVQANSTEQKPASSENITPENNQQASVENINHNNTANFNATATPLAKEKTQIHLANDTKFVSSSKPVAAVNNGAAEKNNTATEVSHIDLKKSAKPANSQFDPAVINNVPKDNVSNDAATTTDGNINATENRPVRRRTNVADAQPSAQPADKTSDAPVTKNATEKSGLNYVSVPEYISMENGNGSVKIQNTSDVDLDLAVVDVQYYDASGRFRKGETLYLHNLRAGKTVVIKTSKDVNSSYATAKVALVSSDAKGVYAVGDN